MPPLAEENVTQVKLNYPKDQSNYHHLKA